MTEFYVLSAFLVIALIARQALIYIDTENAHARACLGKELADRIDAEEARWLQE